jgi:hypothetical protein
MAYGFHLMSPSGIHPGRNGRIKNRQSLLGGFVDQHGSNDDLWWFPRSMQAVLMALD